MTIWTYANNAYETEAEFNAAVSQMKFNLDNSPTSWCTVTAITGSAEDGWVIPETNLTDEEINAISDTGTYQVASIIDGDVSIGLSAADTIEKISQLRTRFAQWNVVTTVIIEAPITSEDMTGYF